VIDMSREGVMAKDSGASAVEFALILPLFLLLVMGTVDFGRAYNQQLSLTEAAREGVRGIALREPGSSAATAQAATCAAIPNGCGSGATAVSVSSVLCPSGVLSSPVPNAKVTASRTFSFITPGLGTLANLASHGTGSTLGTSFTLTGSGVMRCGG
jgi:Flp pilus assembly protein TadG